MGRWGWHSHTLRRFKKKSDNLTGVHSPHNDSTNGLTDYLNCVPILGKFILFPANLASTQTSLHIAVLDEIECAPLAKAQESACRLNGETAAHMRQQQPTLTENAFDIN